MVRGFAITNARIHTSDPEQPRAAALLVQGQKVLDVGPEERIVAKARRLGIPRHDVDGRLVTPGIIDSHTHLVHQGLLRRRVDLNETTSLAQALRLVAAAVPNHRGPGPLLAERWDESRWRERRFPHREDLDNLSRDVPIVLRRIDGHVAVANTPACRLIAKHLSGVQPETGLLVEEASLNLNQVFPAAARESRAALAIARDQALALGITTVHDFVVPNYRRAYRQLERAGRLRLRAHLSLYAEYVPQFGPLGFRPGHGTPRLRDHGVKLFLDGSLGGHTAALRQPYADRPHNHGRLNWTPGRLQRLRERARRLHAPLSAHAIGDAAIDQAVRLLRGPPQAGTPGPHRIEHFELHPLDAFQPLREQGIVASMQPNFVGKWSAPRGMYQRRLGSPRYRRLNEFRSVRDARVPLAFGSDCMPLDPWFGIRSTVAAPFPRQRLPFEDALSAYTRGAAQGLGRSDLGTLAPGHLADLLILEDRTPTRLRGRVRSVFIGGRLEFGVQPRRLASAR